MTDVQIFPNHEITLKTTPHQTSYYSRVSELIRSAKTSISICQYVFSISKSRAWQRSNKIFNLLVSAHERGVLVNVLFDRPKRHSPNINSNQTTVAALKEYGINPRCLAVNRTLHIKLLIFDSSLFLAGSHNLTDSSLYSPFELTFECRDDFLVNSAIIYFNCLFNGSMSEPYEDAWTVVKRGNS